MTPKNTRMVRIDPETYKTIRGIAHVLDRTMGDVVSSAIEGYLLHKPKLRVWLEETEAMYEGDGK